MESINLNIIPSGVSPVCHCSQYDNGRQVRLNLFNGLTPYVLQSGDAVVLNARKPDNTVITADVDVTEGNNYVIIETTTQLCACVGETLAELRITNDTTDIGSLNFVIAVERDVISDGIPSQSVIKDLGAQIDDYIDDNYYNKDETDALLEQKADLSALYDAYPTDIAQGGLADLPDGAGNIPLKSWQSTIEPLQSGIGTPAPDNVCSIAGRNSITITRTAKNLLGGSKLLANAQAHLPQGTTDLSAKTFTYSAGYTPEPFTSLSQGMKFKPNTRYTFIFTVLKSSGTGANIHIRFTDGSNINVAGATVGEKSTLSYTSPSNKTVLDFRKYTGAGSTVLYYDECGVFEGVITAEEFLAYNGLSKVITLPQTVYGGNADITGGKVIANYGYLTLNGSENWAAVPTINGYRFQLNSMKIGRQQTGWADWLSTDLNDNLTITFGASGVANNYIYCRNVNDIEGVTDLTTWKTYLTNNNLHIVFPLDTPIEIDVTPESMNTQKGFNNFYSDCGDSTIEYRADIGLYIAKKLPAPSLGGSLGGVLSNPLGGSENEEA